MGPTWVLSAPDGPYAGPMNLAIRDISASHGANTCRMVCAQGTYPICKILANERRCRLTHWGRVTHICVGNLTIIGSDNGLSPGWRQAITWTSVRILLIGHQGTNFSEMLIEIHTFPFKKIHLKMSSGKWQAFCLGLNVLINCFSHW